MRQVRAGESVLVTDRGELVAELLPRGLEEGERGVRPELVALARKGLVTLGAPNHPKLYPRMPRALRRRTSKQLLDEDRGSQ